MSQTCKETRLLQLGFSRWASRAQLLPLLHRVPSNLSPRVASAQSNRCWLSHAGHVHSKESVVGTQAPCASSSRHPGYL